jgi:hypothetical protein
MIHQAGTILIQRPVDIVFAWAANPEEDFLLGKGAIIRHRSGGPLGVGTTFQVFTPTPTRGRIETTLEITAYVPNHELAWKQTAPALPRLGTVETTNQCRFETVATGTRVTLTIQAERHLDQGEGSGRQPFSKLALLWALPPGVEDGFTNLLLKPTIRRLLAGLRRTLETQAA